MAKFNKYCVVCGKNRENCVMAFNEKEALQKMIEHQGYSRYDIVAIEDIREGMLFAEVKPLTGNKLVAKQFGVKLYARDYNRRAM